MQEHATAKGANDKQQIHITKRTLLICEIVTVKVAILFQLDLLDLGEHIFEQSLEVLRNCLHDFW